MIQYTNGHPYTLTEHSLTWEPHVGVGSITVPLKAGQKDKVQEILNRKSWTAAELRECFAT